MTLLASGGRIVCAAILHAVRPVLDYNQRDGDRTSEPAEFSRLVGAYKGAAAMRTVKWIGMLSGVLLMALGALPGVAQETPAPLIINHAADVVFPSVLRFYITLAADLDDVTRASLELTQDNTRLYNSEIDLEASLFSSAPFTQYRFEWPIPPDSPPLLFEPMTYRWVVATQDGQEDEAEGELVFQPAGMEWQQRGEPPLRAVYSEPELNIGVVRRAVQPAYDLLSEHTRQRPDFDWAIFPRGFAFCTERSDDEGALQSVVIPAGSGEAYPCSEEAGMRIFRANGFRPLQRQMPGLLALQNELAADMFGVFYDAYWGGQAVPAWFRTGLQMLYRVTPDPFALRQAREAARRGRLFAASQLMRQPDSEDRAFWEQQAYLMVVYMADQYGADAPFLLAQSLPGADFDTVFRRVTGGGIQEFLAGWERWILTSRAENAAQWTPYDPMTATPPPSPSSTALPPTATLEPTGRFRTPTLLPSATATATPAAGSGQFVTALPTYTPATPITPTPSNTPRPPGSLNQPAAAQTGRGAGGGICPSAIFPGLLIPMAVVFSARRRRRLP